MKADKGDSLVVMDRSDHELTLKNGKPIAR